MVAHLKRADGCHVQVGQSTAIRAIKAIVTCLCLLTDAPVSPWGAAVFRPSLASVVQRPGAWPAGQRILDTPADSTAPWGMNKRLVIEAIREELRRQFDLLKRASESARADATDEESRARSKYDTQGLEASYLAAGQAERAEELAATIATFGAAPFPPFTARDSIAEGALVETSLAGDVEWFLLAPCAGGMTVEVTGREITVLAPGAPLRKQLQGLKQGGQVKERQLTVKSIG